jgi:uncharacterized protein YkwD
MKTLIFFIFVSFVGFGQSINSLIIQKVNKYRISNHLNPLVVSDSAKLSNQQQLKYMVETYTVPLDHTQKIKTSYPTTFKAFNERINYIHKYGYNFVGENLYGAVYQGTPEQVASEIFSAWVNSPRHNELLLNPNPTGIYVDYKITHRMVVNDVVYSCCDFIFCVLTVYK